MISNTAVPRYYGAFREEVRAGRIPVCEEIDLQMHRIDAKIEDPALWYDDAVVEGFIAYCEAELTLTDGSDLHLLDSFKLWAEDIFGWYYFVEQLVPVPNEDGSRVRYERRQVRKRLCNKQYLIVSRGAAKTMYASCLQSYFLVMDTSTTHQIATAFTMRQADETLSPIRTAITRARGPLYQFLTDGSIRNTTGSKVDRVKLASTKKGIENFITNSRIETVPMSIDKLQSMRTKFATVDEWLSCDIREDVVGAIEQGSSKIDDYLIVAISSEGTVRNAIGDTIKMKLAKILRGEIDAPYAKNWFTIYSNPNIERATAETYQRQLACHIYPRLGEMDIEDVTTDHIQALFNSMNAAKASKDKTRMVLNMIFETALDEGIIAKNPMKSRRLRITGRASEPTEEYSIEQMRYLVQHIPSVADETDRAYLALQALHPLRLEEVLGLKWEDVDREHMRLHICRAVTHPTRNMPEVKMPKTKASIRTIGLSRIALEFLGEGKPDEFVIGGEKPFSYTQVRRMCERIRRDTGFQDRITPIRFRTTVLTDIYDQTKDIKQAQAAAGHTTAAMTLKYYVKGRSGTHEATSAVERAYGIG